MKINTVSIIEHIPEQVRLFLSRRCAESLGFVLVLIVIVCGLSLATWSVEDPSFTHATSIPVHNVFGVLGATISDCLTTCRRT